MNSLTYKLPELTPLEKALPVSKYYTDYPLHKPNPLYSRLLDAWCNESGGCTASGPVV